jgi:LacI family transcriptional regulator, galactose operon repressor
VAHNDWLTGPSEIVHGGLTTVSVTAGGLMDAEDDAAPSRRRWTTMREVASAAGVSLKTVSRVLNGEAGVAPETARRVSAAADALGFRRNESAAMLRRVDQSSRTVGLVIDDLANPFYASLAKAVEDVARSRGSLLVTGSSNQDATDEQHLLLELCARRVDGLLVVACGSDLGYLQAEIDRGTPVVAVDRPAPGLAIDAVLTANAAGAAAAVRQLVGYGHRRIAFIGDTVPYTSSERLEGYRRALAEAGIRPDDQLCRRAHDVAAARAVTASLLDAGATAFFTGNNLITRGAIEALGSRRDATTLIGFDDFALADALAPPVSVVRQDPAALGRQAAELLFARADGDRGPRREITLSTELIVR